MEIKVSKEDIVSWVKKQPDDRKIDMYQNHSNDPCGCLMVQYGKEKFPEVKFEGVGTFSWSSFHRYDGSVIKHAVMDTPINIMLGENWSRPSTFKELKALLS